ncbi:MAG: prolipoprotein diacylglyceryl transferase, partial [Coriobacteriales bacterium]|nr:prolipoprotein diacylglyceryl transferase [Coriobacteriales bacterium]
MSPLAAIAFPPLDPIAVRIGPLAVRWYGLAYVAGFLIAGLVVWWIARRWELGMSADDVVTIVLGCVVGVIIGGRLGYVVFYGLGDYLADPVDIFRVWDGGMSFHGGLVGILVAGVVLARVLRMPWLTLCDLGAVGAPAGIFFGRLANFVN